MAVRQMDIERIRALPATVPIPTAAEVLGMNRDTAYRLIRESNFPLPVLRIGHRLRVSKFELMSYLGINEADHTCDTHDPTTDGEPTYRRAVRRSLDEPVTVTLDSGKRVKVYPNREYKYKGRRGVLGADIIEERRA